MVRLLRDFQTPEQFSEEMEGTLQHGGLLIPHAENVAPRETVAVELAIAGKVVVEVECETVYGAPESEGFKIGVELPGDGKKKLQDALDQLQKSGRWGRDSESIFHAVAKMTTQEKIQLALKGNRQERRVLLKDSHYMVHPYVLKNPKLDSQEISQIARMSTITGDMIHTIAMNTEWMNNPTVRLAIVKNPKTPLNLIQKHIGKVRDQDLLQMAKSESVRDAVSKAAKRVLMSRGRTVR